MYACCVWDQHQRKHIKQLESVKRHAAQFTTGNCHSMNPGCVTNMVTQLGWDLLEHRRAKHRMNPVNPGCVTNMVTQLGWDLLEHRRAKHRMNPVNPGCVTNMVTQLGWDLLEHRRAKHRMNPVNPGCVTNMVTHLGWDLLEHRRAKHGITVIYKITNNLVNIPVYHRLKVHGNSTCGSAFHKFRQLSTKLNCYKYSFLSATIVSWNTLPLEVC